MNTKIILATSALFLGLIGIGLSFLPNEILTYLSVETLEVTFILMQLLGALYLGFGILNWMAKGSIIGGIYNKPIVIGNLMHFGVGALALATVVFGVKENSEIIIALTILYTLFALAFGYIFMVNSNKLKK
jgi:hypothetical protein